MILVTGGTGFIGSHLLERLTALREPVRCLVRPKRTPRELPNGVEPASGDLVTGQGLQDAMRGVDLVIHLAGVTKALGPSDYQIGNVRATETLVRALSHTSARLLHVSSLAAVGPGQDSTPLDEDAEPHPVSEYGRSKLEAERIVRRSVPDAVIVRPPVVYGPRDTDVFQMLKSIAKGLAVEIAGPERWFSAIYVGDLAEGLIAAAQNPVASGRTYFLAYGKPCSWTELRESAALILGRTVRVLRVSPSAARVVGYCAERWSRLTGKPGILSREKVAEAECPYWVCDTRRAQSELGFEAPTSLENGLSQAIAWYKEAGWLTC